MWDTFDVLMRQPNPALYAIPIYITLLIFEIYISFRDRLDIYEARDTAASLSLAIGSIFTDVLAKTIWLSLFIVAYEYRFFEDFLTFHWWAWILLFFADDLSFYCHHRTSHSVRLLWAAHVNHHSSKRYHFATALRQSVTEMFYKYFFYIWLALLGFHPFMILTMVALSLIYQFWIHTQTISKLPAWIEFIFNTPSHHRVHHASNVEYLDKNHGGILIIWDRMFGTFKEEQEDIPVVFGLVQDIETHNPVHIATHEYVSIWKDVWWAPTYLDKLKYVFYPPGWSHDGSKMTTEEMRNKMND